MTTPPKETEVFLQLLSLAEQNLGLTDPNPSVAAAGLDEQGNLLGFGTHQGPGKPHAEVDLIQQLSARGELNHLHTLLVTLEPCNHTGRTPPCTEAILKTPIKRVIIGTHDPNPRVLGGGAERLAKAGIEIQWVKDPEMRGQSQKLIRSFSHWSRLQRPWVVVKTAHLKGGSMIPPQGQKTFSTTEQIHFAHLLRKQSRAIITGSGTILADDPLFTVRHLQDFPHHTRWLVILDRQKRVSDRWIAAAEKRGFQVFRPEPEATLEDHLDFLGKKGVLTALVEAGPQVSELFLNSPYWCEHFQIQADQNPGIVHRIRSGA